MGEDAITLPEKMLELCKHHETKDSVLLPGDSCGQAAGQTEDVTEGGRHAQEELSTTVLLFCRLGKMVRKELEEDAMG